MTTAFYLWEDMRPGAPANDGQGRAEQDLGQLLDLLRADLAASIRPRRELRPGLPLRRWLRRITFVHGG